MRSGVFYFSLIKFSEREDNIMGLKTLVKGLCIIIFTVLFLSGCGGGGGSSSGGSSGYLDGSWSGQWTSNTGERGAITANIQQSGNQISGSVSITNTDLGNAPGSLTGTITNSNGPGNLNLGVAWTNGGSVTYSGTYDNTRISGNYTDSLGGSGTFTLTR
jgi:hypothetical protein